MCNIKALFILHIEKMNFFKKRSKCITFVGIDNIMVGLASVPASAFSLRYMCFIHVLPLFTSMFTKSLSHDPPVTTRTYKKVPPHETLYCGEHP